MIFALLMLCLSAFLFARWMWIWRHDETVLMFLLVCLVISVCGIGGIIWHLHGLRTKTNQGIQVIETAVASVASGHIPHIEDLP